MPRLALIIAVTLSILAPAQSGLPSVVGAPAFVSLDGRFSISLPHTNGFGPLTIPTPFGDARGGMFQWQTKEGTYGVGYADAAKTLEDPDTAKQFFNAATERFNKLATANSGNVKPAKQITLDKYPGIEQRVDLFTGSVVQRTYLVSRRIYETVVVVNNSQRQYESIAVGVLDTFKVLSEAEVTLRRSEEAAKAEPSPLPQTPIAPRDGSDASDEGLRGGVKSVLTESQDLSGTWQVQGRNRDSFATYNQQGNKLRSESYDSKGNLDTITVYGYIDGGRVASFKSIRQEYNPPPGSVATAGSKSDPRYQHRFAFKYDEKKRLIEKTSFKSTGEVWVRHVYKYNGNQREELLYTGDGSLRWRALSALDDKGNEVKQTFEGEGAEPLKESFTYEFDSKGNWIKKTTSRLVMKDGREQFEPYSVVFRTITYY